MSHGGKTYRAVREAIERSLEQPGSRTTIELGTWRLARRALLMAGDVAEIDSKALTATFANGSVITVRAAGRLWGAP